MVTMTLELTFEELKAVYDALMQYDGEYASKDEHELYENIMVRIEENEELMAYYTEIHKKRGWKWEPYTKQWKWW